MMSQNFNYQAMSIQEVIDAQIVLDIYNDIINNNQDLINQDTMKNAVDEYNDSLNKDDGLDFNIL